MSNTEHLEQLDLRVYRAIDEPEMALQFSDAFVEHYNSKGIDPVSSLNTSWLKNPHSYVIACYKDNRPVAGARLQLSNPDFDFSLTTALSSQGIDSREFITNIDRGNHAEACGLWISKQYKGLGLMQFLCGSLLSLGQRLGLDKVYAICPRHTLDSLRRLGYVLKFNGRKVFEFNYPSKDFTSYFVESDVRSMKYAARKERKMMYEQLNRSTELHSSAGRLGSVLVKMNGLPERPPWSFVIDAKRECRTHAQRQSLQDLFSIRKLGVLAART